MIHPSALPAAPVLMPIATLPGATGEAGECGVNDAGFAALLGVQLEAAASEVEPLADLLAAAVTPAESGPDGKILPREEPLFPSEDGEAEGPETSDDTEIEPLLPALPVFQPAPPPPASTQVSPTAPKARPATPILAAMPSPAPTGAEAKADPEAPAAAPLPRLTLNAPEEKPRAPLAEPVRSFASASLPEGPVTPATAFQPVGNLPQAMPAPSAAQPQIRHDFAALVDRLVEARDTALAVKAPQAVAAAITHSDFGEVSIRFEHHGDALSVSLASTDPDFTRAVQAATPAPQSSATGDNNAQPQRQEGGGQQLATGSGNSHQSHPQQRQGGTPARHPGQQQSDGDRQSAQGGVFA